MFSQYLKKKEKDAYSFLSIGNRGVGKTVFLSSIYTQNFKPSNSGMWLEFEDEEIKNNLNNIVNYMQKNGQYPSATLKIGNFDFVVKQRNQKEIKDLCLVRWWDIPGETCNLRHPGFLNLLVNSDGCCYFLDGYELIKNLIVKDNQAVKQLLKPLLSLLKIFVWNGLNLPFAIVITKIDLLNDDQIRKLNNILKKYVEKWIQGTIIDYKIFYSGIILVKGENHYQLKIYQSETPFFWLLTERFRLKPLPLEKIY